MLDPHRWTVPLFALSVLAVASSVLAADRTGKPQAGDGSLVAKVSTEVSGYSDTDSVRVASPSVAASVSDVLAGWSFGGHYLIDVVSAASVDIVSTASSKWVETRHAGSADGNMKFGSATAGVSGVFSVEPDYVSLAGGATLSVDMFDKNVTPFFGLSYGNDQVGRHGLPQALWHQKLTYSGQLGVTFVVNRSTISSLQADLIEEDGYLAKPYRYVPLFAPGQGASIQPGASVDEVNAKRVNLRPAEQLPGARHRFTITSRLAHRFDKTTLRLDERAYSDTWGLNASTTDMRLMVQPWPWLLFWPHVRFHAQNHVTFWQRAYEVIPGPSGTFGVPAIRTGDRELSALYTATLGLGTRWKLIDDFRKSWDVVYEIDGAYTRYLEALYISERFGVFSTLALEATF